MAPAVERFGEPGMGEAQENSHPLNHVKDDDSSVPVTEKRWPGWPGESVFRIVVPAQKVGGIIGRKGEFIKKMCEESRARIKILDGHPGIAERAVMISAKEELDASIPPAVDGLLRVHKRIVDGIDDSTNAPLNASTVSTRLLVAGTQAASLIGRQGATIKSIQESTNCVIRVLGSEQLPDFALQDDRIVEIQGEPLGVHKAIELAASHLRKFLVDRSVLPLFENHMAMAPNPRSEQNMPPPFWSQPQGPPLNSGGPAFGNDPQFMSSGPFRQHDNYYPPSDIPLEKLPHQGVHLYGREAPMGANLSSNSPAPQLISKVTQCMQIPLSYADAVIGTAGASISYIRRTSGATITIQETKGVSGEMTVEINGTATQVQTAQQLIQNFMAEAAGPVQHNRVDPPLGSWPNPAASADPGYSSYQSHGSMYTSPYSNAAGPPPGNIGGGYGSSYASTYGY